LAKARYNPGVADSFAQPIDGRTRYCAVYGFPVGHSASPAMQNGGITALGLNWRYLAFEVHPENLRAAIEGAKRMNFIGLNLTIPHKLLAMDLVDVLDESARVWGAVNTVRFEAKDGHGIWRPAGEFAEAPHEVRSHGFNTDADAIARSLHEDLGLEMAGARILLLGAGGAGRTAALKLAAEKVAELFLVNRTWSRAESVAREINARYPGVKATLGYPTGSVGLLLNATSLGLKPDDPLPFEPARFSLHQAEAVYDMVYRPAQTELLEQAKAAGCRIANGLGMLLYQGAKALELWSGRPAPVQVMRRALEKNVYGES
jgi:shikimate dehydrogenase